MIRAAALIALVLATAACGGAQHRSATAPARTLTNLHDVGQLETAFNNASGEPRLIVLMSPT